MGLFNKKQTQLTTYAPGRYYDPNTTELTSTYDQLYAGKATLRGKNGSYSYEVDVGADSIDLTPEQQLAIKNNSNMKETQKRLKNQGVGQQQTVMGGGGY